MTTEHTIDRNDWESGPWDEEPEDRVEWRHGSGLACLMVRNDLGAWCGYVAVPPGHPWHGVGYDDVPSDVDVHGGLTYADRCAGPVCHVARPGEPDDVWWLGFDCCHSFDVAPSMARYGGASSRVYRVVAWVRAEVERLAVQVLAAASPAPRSRLYSVALSARAADEAGEEMRDAFERAAERHRDPQYEARLDALRCDLAVLSDEELRARAERHYIRDLVSRSALIELVAAHEAAHATMLLHGVAGR